MATDLYLVINNNVENRKTALNLKHTAFINDSFDADEGCGQIAKTRSFCMYTQFSVRITSISSLYKFKPFTLHFIFIFLTPLFETTGLPAWLIPAKLLLCQKKNWKLALKAITELMTSVLNLFDATTAQLHLNESGSTFLYVTSVGMYHLWMFLIRWAAVSYFLSTNHRFGCCILASSLPHCQGCQIENW